MKVKLTLIYTISTADIIYNITYLMLLDIWLRSLKTHRGLYGG